MDEITKELTELALALLAKAKEDYEKANAFKAAKKWSKARHHRGKAEAFEEASNAVRRLRDRTNLKRNTN